MNKLVDIKYLQLEDSRLALIERLKSVQLSQLEIPPFHGKWSVSQIFYHLNKAETLSVLYVSKKRLDIKNLKKTGIKEQLKMIALKVRFALPFVIKAPVSVLGDVPENVDYKLIVSEWNETRNKLKTLLDSLSDDMLYKNVFKQPAIGRINIFQMLDFMQAHFNRHKEQIERIVVKNPS
jgi:hypothetical protein